jgi:glycosyltransferase involved in cell wall biosynthesis
MQVINWSVVIPTRNRAQMLKRCIESAFQQSVPVEVVVVDEASSDNTEEVVKAFGPRVIYHRNQSAVGQAKAENIGIRLASGSWIKPIDDDDYLSSGCLREMGTKLEGCFARGENPVLISGKYVRVDEHGNSQGVLARPMSDIDTFMPSKNLLEAMLRDAAPIGTPLQCAHSREAALAVGGWNENRVLQIGAGNDIEFWIRLARHGGCLFTSFIAGYRTEWPGNSHHSFDVMDRYLVDIILKQQLAEALQIRLPKRIIRRLAMHWILVAIKHSEFREAARIALVPQSVFISGQDRRGSGLD